MGNIRLKDIAGKVGVSTTAVCNVLNNKPIRISEEKRDEILKLAEKLNYKPDIIASGLKNKSTRSIGIVIPDMRTLFYPEIIHSIEMDLRDHGYHTIICNTADEPALEKEQIEDLMSRRVDALVVAAAGGTENLEFLRSINKSGIPMIFIDRYYKNEQFNFVATDNMNAAAAGVDELLKMNKDLRKIIYIGDRKRNQSLDDRLEGVKKEAARRKLFFSEKDIFLSSPERKKIRKIGFEIFSSNLSTAGIFLESNRFLTGLLDAAGKHNKTIPDDFSIIGFDAFELKIHSDEDLKSLRVLKKTVPIIHQDIEGISRTTVEYLLTCLKSPESEKKEVKLKLPVRIS